MRPRLPLTAAILAAVFFPAVSGSHPAYTSPTWWLDPAHPIVNLAIAPDNAGAANIGQAKWVVKNALRALFDASPSVAANVEGALVGVGKPLMSLDPPPAITAGWLEKQKAPLLLGQLKALAAPFYESLHAVHPEWLEGEMAINRTKDPADPANYFPWTSDENDDRNHAVVTIGQVKACFALRFETIDSDHDGLPDGWELSHFGVLSLSGHADPDEDGYTNFEELSLGSDPSVADTPFTDTDEDGMPDAYETARGLSASVDDSMEDLDGDRVPNIFEYKLGTPPDDGERRPPAKFEVNPTTGDNYHNDLVFRTIGEAIDAAYWGVEAEDYVTSPCPIILVRGGVYAESVAIPEGQMLLEAELGSLQGPVEIRTDEEGAALSMRSSSVVDGFVITHEAGIIGSGVEIEGPWWNDSMHGRLINCIVRGNNANVAGGIFISNSSLDLVHCVVSGNSASMNYPGIILYGTYSRLSLVNSVISRNQYTGAVLNNNRQLVLAANSEVVASSQCPSFIGDPPGNSAPGWLFVTQPGLSEKGFVIDSLSAVVDAGGAPPGTKVKYDILGKTRSFGGIPDLGATEFIPAYLDDGSQQGPIPASPNMDSDGDGIPDQWEVAQGMNPYVFNPPEDFQTYLDDSVQTGFLTVYTALH